METKRFTKNDSGFICAHCGKKVEPLGYSSRNHCPFCLWSLHVDVMPGDRANECGGQMEPVAVLSDPRKGYIIIHKCAKCGEIRRNKAASEAPVQPDDIGLMLKIMKINADSGTVY
ncbi:MAG: RNHCP domain-containing protein [Clostridia bacterium]|nr:RNHCP domain-containing protein [Clostridia bacterium]